MTDLIFRSLFFFFNDTATTEIYTLSLHDALPILNFPTPGSEGVPHVIQSRISHAKVICSGARSEEHTSELQSQSNLVCRLLLEKKKTPPLRRPRARVRPRPRGRHTRHPARSGRRP